MRKVKNGREMLEALRDGFNLTEEKFVEVHSKLAFDSYANIIRLNPRKTGFSRSNWHMTSDPPSETTVKPPKAAKGTSNVFLDSMAVPPSLKVVFGDRVTIYNNTVYIGLLEQGSSVQAPIGMVEPTRNRLNAEMERLLRVLSKKDLNI